MRRFVASAVLAFALLVPAQALAKIEGLDPHNAGSPLTAANAIAANPAEITGATLPEFAYEGGTSGVPLGVGDKSQAPDPTVLTDFPTQGNTYAILSNGEINSVASLFSAEDFGSTEYFNQEAVLGVERGPAAQDWTVLKINVNVPAESDCLALDYRFLSEEYPEFVGSEFNDAFFAEVDSSSWMVEDGGGLFRPNDFAASPAGAPISVNGVGETAMAPAEAEGTYFNAATGLITTKTPISPGAHSIYLSIFDASDHVLDSAVFLDNLRFINESAVTCKPPIGKELSIPAPTPAGSPPPPPSNAFTLGPSIKFKGSGSKALITVNVPGPGTVTAGSPPAGAAAARISRASASAKPHGGKVKAKKPLLVPTSVHAGKAGPVTLTVSLSGAGKALLAKKGKLTVPVSIGFTPDGGVAAAPQKKTVTFKKPHKKKHHKHSGKGGK